MVGWALLGGIVGGLVVFAWGAVSWMALPWHQTSLLRFKNEVAVAKAVRGNAPQAGTYLLLAEHWRNPTAEQKTIPKGFMLFGAVRQGSPTMSSYYLRGLAIEMVAAFLLSWLLLSLKGLTYWGRVRVATTVAVVAWAMVRLPDWNWWGFSMSFTLLAILDLVIGWFLGGVAIAAFTRNRQAY